MRLAVCLLTCGREEETALTLKTFQLFADRPGLIKLHGDDGGQRDTNKIMAAADGFDLVHAPKQQLGAFAGARALWREASRRGATHILHLENDQEFTGPLPHFEEPECVRLYGARKARSGPRALTGPYIMGTRHLIEWKPWRRGWERARAHWGGQASITRAEILCAAAERVGSIKGLSLDLTNLDTVRPVENITWHLCERTTAGGVF